MRVLEVFGICVVALLALLFAIYFRARLFLLGGGTIRLQVRISTLVRGRGWSTGIGRFYGDELRFYRMFSLAWRPKRILDRADLVIDERRAPEGPERLTMPSHWIVLRLSTRGDQFDIAMPDSTVTGFLSWLEAAPPGAPGSVAPRPVIQPRPIDY
jgi:hypothetical protein